MGKRRKTFKQIRAAAWPASEADLAAVVIEHLQQNGWEVFQEVLGWANGPVADIIARRPGRSGADYLVVECKRRLSLNVLAQAARWKGHAHYIAVALPKDLPNSAFETAFARQVCKDQGIGWMSVRRSGVGARPLPRSEAPKAEAWQGILCEEHKCHAKAGTNKGGHWTPFKKTVESLKAYVAEHPGCLLREAVQGIEHHYRTPESARSSLLKMINEGVIVGVRLERAGRSWALY